MYCAKNALKAGRNTLNVVCVGTTLFSRCQVKEVYS